jgi:hypothetical protein
VIRDLPIMLRQIVENAVSQQTDMDVMDDWPAAGPPDVAIVGARSTSDTEVPLNLLERWPRSRVLVLTIDGADAAMVEFRPHITRFGALSRAKLINILRSGAAGGAS